MEIGIRELKAKLSEYVERAGKGESIHVTDRGRVKAILGPVPNALNLDRAVEEGWVTRGNGKPSASTRTRHRGRVTIAESFAEDRGE